MRTRRHTHLSCFLVGQGGAHAPFLYLALRSLGIDVVKRPDENQDLLRLAISSADFVIAWVEPQASNGTTILEVGIAIGLDKPVIALTDIRNPGRLPSGTIPIHLVEFADTTELASILSGRLPIDRLRPRAAAEVPVRRIAASGPAAPQPPADIDSGLFKSLGKGTVALGHSAQSLFRESTDPRLSKSSAVDLIERGLRWGGSSSIQRASRRSTTNETVAPDLAVWVDELEWEFGNPTIIDVDRGLTSQTLALATRKIRQYLVTTGTDILLIVHIRPVRDELIEMTEFPGQHVRWIWIQDLFQQWQSRSFAEIVRYSTRWSH